MKAVKNGTYKIIEGQQSNTNCLINIPNDINLELNNGSLILKAGSKVYVPKGFEQDGTTRKFDVVTVQNDLTLSSNWGNAEKMLLFLDRRKDRLDRMSVARCHGGTTAPSSTRLQYWYDTTENLVKQITNGVVGNTGTSLPIAIFTAVGNNTPSASSIDQVFNGFGYIGSIIFAVPQVSGLIPDGKNADGSFKCTNAVNTTVATDDYASFTSATQRYIRFARNRLGDGYLYYDSTTNFNYFDSDYTAHRGLMVVGNYSTNTNGKITSMTITKSVRPETIPLYKAIKAYEKGEYYGN